MRVLRKNLLYIVSLCAALTFAACENPFDPLDTASEIRGLTYIVFDVKWDRWDSDPEFDGVSVGIEYFNEFGDALSFHNKDHDVVIEFYTQKPAYFTPVPDKPEAEPTPGPLTFDSLFFSYPATFGNSEDLIRIPIEAYAPALAGNGYDRESESKAFVLLRVYPPDASPQAELNSWQNDVTVFKPEDVPVEEPDPEIPPEEPPEEAL